MLEKEEKTFEQKLPGLIATDIGNYVLIKDEKVIGTFAAITDALKTGYEKFREQPFFVRQILPAQKPLSFANNHLFS